MKFPDVFSTLIGKKEAQKNFFFSLYVDLDAAAVATWYVDSTGAPKIASFAHGKVAEHTWEARIHVIDRLLSAAEDKAKVERAITQTVFGMPGVFLTREGNLSAEIRPHLKKLTTVLELSGVGFVPLAQAITFSFKKDEGVPPSIILIGCSGNQATLTIFRVGNMTGEEVIDIAVDPAAEIEKALKQYQHADVLPSRMLLYGGDESILDIVRGKLLKHPWPTRTNFLHFPKIEILSTEKLLTAVSLAGASELATTIGDMPADGLSDDTASVVAQPSMSPAVEVAHDDHTAQHDQDEVDVTPESAEDIHDEEHADATQDDGQDGSVQAESSAESDEPEHDTIMHESDQVVEDEEDLEESNIHVVSPEALGFERQDVLVPSPAVHNRGQRDSETPPRNEHVIPSQKSEQSRMLRVPSLAVPRIDLHTLRTLIGRMPKFRAGVPKIAAFIVIVCVIAVLYYVIPRATVTVFVAPVTLEESAVITVDSAATIADPATKIIPGRTQEKSITGEKTEAVTGKKKIGDPARGTVTIYNKSTSASRTFKKGTVLTAKSLKFTLDADVSVASASENLIQSQTTYGKNTVPITAETIGAASNLASGEEFTIDNISTSIAIGRNDAAFTGGVSRDVTVVTRADYDNIVKILTGDLVGKAKTELSQQIGAERLIDQTVQTIVAEKVFDKELDEEAVKLLGKVTITVSGITIRDEDIKTVLTPAVAAKIPVGYSLSGGQTDVETRNITVKKDGKITFNATLKAVALPVIDNGVLISKLAGKNVPDALNLLKKTQGVAGAEFLFAPFPTQKRLPFNAKNITVSVAIQQ